MIAICGKKKFKNLARLKICKNLPQKTHWAGNIFKTGHKLHLRAHDAKCEPLGGMDSFGWTRNTFLLDYSSLANHAG
jgi:hypothetical protein